MKKATIISLFLFFSFAVFAQQPLETEEAILPKAGTLEWENTFEYQFSKEGKEIATPMAFAYGITDRLEVLAEPVFYTSILPDTGRTAKGVGDFELTLTYNFCKEKKYIPAFAFAGEVKIPVSKDALIGTGKTDYTLYLIASKTIGRSEVHANLGFTILGRPDGMQLNNIFDFAIAEEFHWTKKLDLLAELIGNTSSEPTVNGFGIEDAASPELTGGEFVGMIGARWFFTPSVYAALGVTYDNNNAILIRPGISFLINTKHKNQTTKP